MSPCLYNFPNGRYGPVTSTEKLQQRNRAKAHVLTCNYAKLVDKSRNPNVRVFLSYYYRILCELSIKFKKYLCKISCKENKKINFDVTQNTHCARNKRSAHPVRLRWRTTCASDVQIDFPTHRTKLSLGK